MKRKVYIETSVASYLTARPSRDLVVAAHQEITAEWWENQRDRFDLYISELVLPEAGESSPARFVEDALHVAVAATQGLDSC